METLTKDLIGRKIKINSVGSDCNFLFHNSIGIIRNISDSGIAIFITDGYYAGWCPWFVKNSFKYKILNEDWDE